MGMSGRTYNSRSNEITKDYYNILIATGRRHFVYTRVLQNGDTAYFMNN